MKFLKCENVQEGTGFPTDVFIAFGRKTFIKTEIIPVNFEENEFGMSAVKRTSHYNGWYIKIELPFKKNKKFIDWGIEPDLIGDQQEIKIIPCRKVIMYSSRLAYLNKRMRGFTTVWNPLVPNDQKAYLAPQPD